MCIYIGGSFFYFKGILKDIEIVWYNIKNKLILKGILVIYD